MPRDLLDVGALAKSPTFLLRLTAAMARVASCVGREGTGTAEHYVLRRDLARDFVKWTDDTVQGMAWLVASQSDVTADIDDGRLVAIVNDLWSAAAGAGQYSEWSAFDEAAR